MRRRDFLPLAATPLLAQPSRPKPNFLIIYTDDQGIGDVGCYGHPDVRTPHIDSLAADGVRFTQWYSNAPVCSASRASLLTGKYPERTGVTGALPSRAARDVDGLRQGEVTLPAELRKLGYQTAAIGKWHLGSSPHSRPLAQGFDRFFGFYSGWLDAYSHRYYQLGGNPGFIFHDLWRNETEVFEEPMYMTELLGREALSFLKQQTPAKPFFLHLAFGAPHYSMMSPRRYQQRFPTNMERDRRDHLAMIAALDDQVGNVIATLKAQGLYDNTVIYFQSDNGGTREQRASHFGGPNSGASNKPFRGWKLGLFEGGIRVPAILRAPRLSKPGTTNDQMLATMNIMPTFLDLAGAAQPKNIDGTSLVPMLRGNTNSPNDHICWAFNKSRAIRKGDWKLHRTPIKHPGDPEEPPALILTNLNEDPQEQRNWADFETGRVTELSEKLEAWERYVGL